MTFWDFADKHTEGAVACFIAMCACVWLSVLSWRAGR